MQVNTGREYKIDTHWVGPMLTTLCPSTAYPCVLGKLWGTDQVWREAAK